MARQSNKRETLSAAGASIEPDTVDIGSVVVNPRNPRKHPPDQLDRLAASIRRFGQTRDVLVRKANRMIIAGHGVTEACKLAGRTMLRVVLWDVDQPTADAFMLGDNRLAQLGRDDDEQIRALLREFGLADVESIGFSATEAEALLADAADQLDVIEIPTGAVADRFWISIRGPLAHQATVLRRLNIAVKELSGVSVELGTVADG